MVLVAPASAPVFVAVIVSVLELVPPVPAVYVITISPDEFAVNGAAVPVSAVVPTFALPTVVSAPGVKDRSTVAPGSVVNVTLTVAPEARLPVVAIGVGLIDTGAAMTSARLS